MAKGYTSRQPINSTMNVKIYEDLQRYAEFSGVYMSRILDQAIHNYLELAKSQPSGYITLPKADRCPLGTTIKKNIAIALKDYSDTNGISMTKVLDRAVYLYLENAKKQLPDGVSLD